MADEPYFPVRNPVDGVEPSLLSLIGGLYVLTEAAMLRDRYDPLDLFALVPAQGMASDPVLMRLDALLDDDELFQTVKADLARRFPHTLTQGRPSTPVEVILRLLIVKHFYGWSYEQTECWVSDSLVLRQFCRVYAERVPDDTTLLRWANTIQPSTLHHLLEHVVDLARQRRITRGRKLRIDSTVVATNIHYPVDSSLLGDGVRVLNRVLQRARLLVQPENDRTRATFRDRTRSAQRVMRRLIATSRQRGEQVTAQLQEDYRRLMSLAEHVVQQAREVRAMLPTGDSACHQVVEQLETFIPRVERVIRQARRRV